MQCAAIRHAELLKIVPLGRHQIRRLEKAGKFPKRFKLSDNTVAWVRSEVEDWLRERIGRPITVSGQVAPPDSPETPKSPKASVRRTPSAQSSKTKNAQPLERLSAL